jgi:thiamine biosynthesis protein ThiS
MQITVNGKTCTFEQIVTIQDLLDELQLTGRLAIEVNKEIIPRSRFNKHTIRAGDTIEIVRAIGGG